MYTKDGSVDHEVSWRVALHRLKWTLQLYCWRAYNINIYYVLNTFELPRGKEMADKSTPPPFLYAISVKEPSFVLDQGLRKGAIE